MTAPPDIEQWLTLFQAHCIVELEARRQHALRSLTDTQLQLAIWIGLHDAGWAAVFDEADRRGLPWRSPTSEGGAP